MPYIHLFIKVELYEYPKEKYPSGKRVKLALTKENFMYGFIPYWYHYYKIGSEAGKDIIGYNPLEPTTIIGKHRKVCVAIEILV